MRKILFIATLCALGMVLVFNHAHSSSRTAEEQLLSRTRYRAAGGAHADPVAHPTASELPQDTTGNLVKTVGPQLLAALPVATQSGADVRLAAEIRTAILNDSKVSSISDDVTILVRGGMVTLQGRVNELEQKRAVESDTRSVSGVEQVDNLLVTPGS